MCLAIPGKLIEISENPEGGRLASHEHVLAGTQQ
jgi:hydrogenase maturation factor